MDIKLISDQAIGEGDSSKTDGLGFETYSKILSNAAIDTKGPFTIGVFGEWGNGKTSLLRLVKRRLDKNDSVVTIWFNAWRYEKDQHPIVPLIATIIAGIEENQSFKQKIAEKGKSFINALRAVAYGFSSKSKLKIPGLAEIEASFVAKDMIERKSELNKDPLLDKSLYYQAFERLSEVQLDSKFKIVVIIDDLDRCFPNNAIELLESIKLILSQPNMIFFLGVARTVIEGYLQHKYTEEYGIKDFDGKSYLDKIVQLPFYIPNHNTRLGSFSSTLLQSLDDSTQAELKDLMPLLGHISDNNPRSVIRFINNLIIDGAIYNELLSSDGKGQPISLRFFGISRALQQKWQRLFAIFVTSESTCENVAKWARISIDGYLESKNENDDLYKVASIMYSDYAIQEILFSDSGRKWLKDSKLRKATTEFLLQTRRESHSEVESKSSAFKAYISYQQVDVKSAKEIANILHKEGISTFIDSEYLSIGVQWEKVLRDALDKTENLILIFGNQYSEKSWMNKELFAVLNKKIRILPVLLDDFNTNILPEEVQKFQWLDLRGKTINAENLMPLIRAIISA